MVTMWGVVGEGGSDGATAAEDVVERKTPIKTKESSTVAVAIGEIFLDFDQSERE